MADREAGSLGLELAPTGSPQTPFSAWLRYLINDMAEKEGLEIGRGTNCEQR